MIRIAVAAGALVLAGAASAQPDLVARAIATGQAGERFDGYLGATPSAPAAVRRAVAAVNIRRRTLYIDLAASKNVSVQLVGSATSCQLLAGVAVGQVYQLEDHVWRRREAGQPAPVPDYCR